MTQPYELPELECLRCGHHWPPRTQQRPKVCPSCKSRIWDKPPKVRSIADLSAEQRRMMELVMDFRQKVDPARVEQVMRMMELELQLARKAGE